MVIAACLIGTIAGMVISCSPTGGVIIPIVDFPEGESPRDALTAFLSSNRPQVVRGDGTEGTAELRVTASMISTFDWSVCVNPAPDGSCDERPLLSVCVGATESACTELPAEGGRDPLQGGESILRVLDVLRDPGSLGTKVRISGTVTQVTDAANPDQVTDTIELTIVRPAGELGVSMTAEASRVAPCRDIILTAIITGGSPYTYRSATQPNPCRPVEPADDADVLRIAAADAQPEFCIAWTVDNRSLAPNDDCDDATGSGPMLEPLPLETGLNGETISSVRYRAPVGVGSALFTVEASDRRGSRAPGSFVLTVTPDDVLTFAEASSERSTLPPGGMTNLRASAVGGQPPYFITFELASPDRKGGLSGNGLEGVTSVTSPACEPSREGVPCVFEVGYEANADNVGSELVSVEIEDAVGATANTTIGLSVASNQQLSIVAFSGTPAVQPNKEAEIGANVTGGTPPYTICFGFQGDEFGDLQEGDEECEPTGAVFDDFVTCACDIGNNDLFGLETRAATRTYESPSMAGAVALQARVRDAVGALATSVISLNVNLAAGTACGDGQIDAPEECDPPCPGCPGANACSIFCRREICGNGILDPLELCDDGNTNAGDGCAANCGLERCGNGFVDGAGEQCDDGDNDNSDACTNICTNAVCGDRFVRTLGANPEECDDGGNSVGCDLDCTFAECGDAFVNALAGEQCDDGNTTGGDGCSSDCRSESCGNGKLDSGEQCDDGNNSNTDACTNGCLLARCGDTFTRAGVEQCDDGNSSNNDLCTNQCRNAVCGDGFVRMNGANPEECDDGNEITSDACTNLCLRAVCGDGIIWQGVEMCDDGNTNNGDTCNSTCGSVQCGNGLLDSGEECDDGDNDNTDACTSFCRNAVCGDGFVRTGTEECDDGDDVNDNGCSNTCQASLPECGNDMIETGEECDGGLECNGNCTCDRMVGYVPMVPRTEDCEIACGNGRLDETGLTGQFEERCDGGLGCIAPGMAGDCTCSAPCFTQTAPLSVDCQPVPNCCGNGIVEPANLEECDHFNGNADCTVGDVCNSSCQCVTP